ncbi:granule-bound starch synthase 1, chloroplastic/amyloplastic-like [Silene latifolia]|uniref:granule-bound starch synthase 1, chloroplastic/amyloplastic-like n=1 Tax=Silene latifolia TaxID=37657 RepID=UPI003D788881
MTRCAAVLNISGTGKKEMENLNQEPKNIFPNNARGLTKFYMPLPHMIVAGDDFTLISSRFFLTQIPIVASTRGLVDTVKEGFTRFQMGHFNANCDAIDPGDVNAVVAGVKKTLASR